MSQTSLREQFLQCMKRREEAKQKLNQKEVKPVKPKEEPLKAKAVEVPESPNEAPKKKTRRKKLDEDEE